MRGAIVAHRMTRATRSTVSRENGDTRTKSTAPAVWGAGASPTLASSICLDIPGTAGWRITVQVAFCADNPRNTRLNRCAFLREFDDVKQRYEPNDDVRAIGQLYGAVPEPLYSVSRRKPNDAARHNFGVCVFIDRRMSYLTTSANDHEHTLGVESTPQFLLLPVELAGRNGVWHRHRRPVVP